MEISGKNPYRNSEENPEKRLFKKKVGALNSIGRHICSLDSSLLTSEISKNVCLSFKLEAIYGLHPLDGI